MVPQIRLGRDKNVRLVFVEGKQGELLREFALRKNLTRAASAKMLGVTESSLKNWVGEKRTLPAGIFMEILRRQPDLGGFSRHILKVLDAEWGRRKGGQRCYAAIMKKYGENELARRRRAGGASTIKQRLEQINKRMPPHDDAGVLELLGALIGDGWIGISGGRKQVCYCGNISQLDYALHLQTLLERSFHVRGYLKTRKKFSVFYIIINSGPIFEFFRATFGFPVGPKTKFNVGRLPLGWGCASRILRGIFDTDGGIYFDNSEAYARPYPTIDITSHNPELLDCAARVLVKKGFKIIRLKYSIRLKTVGQVERWFKEIMPSNKVHIRKWNRWKSQYMGP